MATQTIPQSMTLTMSVSIDITQLEELFAQTGQELTFDAAVTKLRERAVATFMDTPAAVFRAVIRDEHGEHIA